MTRSALPAPCCLPAPRCLHPAACLHRAACDLLPACTKGTRLTEGAPPTEGSPLAWPRTTPIPSEGCVWLSGRYLYETESPDTCVCMSWCSSENMVP
eukprot:196751-Chlamydomonas_euryale.AAC.2